MELANRELLPFVNALLGTTAKTFDELVDSLLPSDILELKRLAIMYEGQMVMAKDARAYFSACVMGASMIEGILLILCLFNRSKVENTRCYKERAGEKEGFEKRIWRLGLDDFIDVADELKWIPEHLIDDEWKRAIPSELRDIASRRRPNQSKAEREALAAWAASNSALVLMRLLNIMRNRVHPGRWVRERHKLADELAFDTWSQVVLVAAFHLRDCLFTELQNAMKLHLMRTVEKSISRKLFYGEDVSEIAAQALKVAERFRQTIPTDKQMPTD